ncbi:hypothetical protein ACQ4WX_07210 [Streptomyces lasalocidi]
MGVRRFGRRARLAQRPCRTAELEDLHEHLPAHRAHRGRRRPGARTGAASTGPTPASVVRTLSEAADHAVRKLRAVAPGMNGFPVGTKFEKWVFSQNGDWVGGFWPGTLWMAYLRTRDDMFRTPALYWARRLAPRRYDTTSHDLGFLFYPSWVTAWRLTGDDTWSAGAVQAADSLIQRYNPRGRFIRAWGALDTRQDAGRVIMDTLMNLDLLGLRQAGGRGTRSTWTSPWSTPGRRSGTSPGRTARRPTSSTSTPTPAHRSDRTRSRATALPPAGRAGRPGGSTASRPCTAAPVTGRSCARRGAWPTMRREH